jgi:hypothetical protein
MTLQFKKSFSTFFYGTIRKQKISVSLGFIFFFLNFPTAYSQFNIRDSSIAFSMIGVTLAYQVPGGDMSDRFGNNLNVGGVFQWKLKSNWIIGLEGNFLFGEDVKEDNILNKYLTPDGNIIDGNGEYASIILYERGLKFDLKVGKIFPVIGPNVNSGLMTTIGIGLLQHRIRIETLDSPIPYLEDDYEKGYDRLSSGLSLTEFIGYMNFGNKRLSNFYAGLEFTQAFTENVRAMNFDTGKKDDKSRLDLLFGLRIGWVFPIYKRASDKSYIN